MIALSMERIKAELSGFEWFKNVGGDIEIDQNTKIKKIAGWEKTAAWAEHKMSWWCGNKYLNILTKSLDKEHRKEYQKWNEICRQAYSFLDLLMVDKIYPKIPMEYRGPGILKWIEYQLCGIILEDTFSELVNLKVLDPIKQIYKKGFFPCGLYVEKEKEFPGHVTIVVF